MSVRPSVRRLVLSGVAVATLSSMAACSSLPAASPGSDSGETATSTSADGDTTQGSTDEAAADKPVLSASVDQGATAVPVDTAVRVGAQGGELTKVKVSSSEGALPGSMNADATRWSASDYLEPGTTYTVKAVADNDGTTARRVSKFTTQDLSLPEQTYPSVSPLQGETVGVGMPIIVNFDVPVTDRAAIEKHLHVTSSAGQVGSWHWMSDNVVHYRPKNYWKAGSDIQVDVDINGVDAGNGIYGQEDRVVDFKVGDKHVYKIDAQSHQMKVLSNGKLLRTIPITTGKAGFTTRSGTKIIMEKFASKRMNSETVGIGGSEAYDLDDVQYAMRLTNSGEFIHAAPWSVGSQGYANVSHGCTGMSTDNASWLFNMTLRGDVTQTVGTGRPMEFDNGYGDWNESFQQYEQGSAL